MWRLSVKLAQKFLNGYPITNIPHSTSSMSDRGVHTVSTSATPKIEDIRPSKAHPFFSQKMSVQAHKGLTSVFVCCTQGVVNRLAPRLRGWEELSMVIFLDDEGNISYNCISPLNPPRNWCFTEAFNFWDNGMDQAEF